MAFGLLLASFFLSFFFRTSASVVLPRLATDWGLSAAVTGLISSLYFYAYALIQPICGALNDRFGPMRVAAVGLAIASLGAICFALARSALLLAVGRLLTGLGLSSMLSGTVAFQNASSAPERHVFFSGLTYFVGNLGAVASVVPLGICSKSLPNRLNVADNRRREGCLAAKNAFGFHNIVPHFVLQL